MSSGASSGTEIEKLTLHEAQKLLKGEKDAKVVLVFMTSLF